MRGRHLARSLLVALMVLSAQAVPAATNPDEIMSDPALEARARALSKELRCLVCQNQSIDDSDAELARDLRRIVREELEAGKSDEEIIAFLTARYGDFVLLKPPVKPATYGLWIGPFVLLAIGGLGLAVYLRRRPREPLAANGLSPEERRRLDALLDETGEAGPRGS